MTESQAAVMVADMIRDTFEDAQYQGGDTFIGSMLIEGVCSGFCDARPVKGPHIAGFRFEQSGLRYTVHVQAERIGPQSARLLESPRC